MANSTILSAGIRLRVSVVLCLALAVPAAADAPAAWSFGAAADLNTKYVWRGIDLVDGPVLQPSVMASYGPLTGSVWGNVELTDANGRSWKLSEVDYTMAGAWSLGGPTFGVGLIHYAFPNTSGPSTTELYGSLSWPVALSPTLTLYYDFDEANGLYASASASHTFAAGESRVSPVVSVSVGCASSGFVNYYYGSKKSAFTDAMLSLKLPVRISDLWTAAPSVSYSLLIDHDIRRTQSDLQLSPNSNLWLGISVSASL